MLLRVFGQVERVMETDVDVSQDWMEVQGCRVRLVHGDSVAWTTCDLSKVMRLYITVATFVATTTTTTVTTMTTMTTMTTITINTTTHNHHY